MKCPHYKICRNGNGGCVNVSTNPQECVRYMPLEGTHLTEVNLTIETPPHIDSDKCSQILLNIIDGLGWLMAGTIKPLEDEDS